MSRVCSITGKKSKTANNVSHSNRKTKRVQRPNLIKKRIFIPEENRTVTLKLSARALRTLAKKDISEVIKEKGLKL